MNSQAKVSRSVPLNRSAYLNCFTGILTREFLRFVSQRSRFLSSLVRPLLWLIVFAAGFRAALGISIIPPYETYITYEVYIAPGLCCMILLFNGMQSSLSMVYDREMGSMRVLLIEPTAPRLSTAVQDGIHRTDIPGAGIHLPRHRPVCGC